MIMKKYYGEIITLVFLLTMFLGLFTGCRKSDDPLEPIDVDEQENGFLSDDTLVFRGEQTKVLTLTPQSDAAWNYEISDYFFKWFDVGPWYGYLDNGESASVSVESDFYMLQPDVIYEDFFVVSSTFGVDTVVVIGHPDTQIRQYVPDVVYFPSGEDCQRVAVTKFVDESMSYSVVSSSAYVRLSASEGNMAKEQVKAWFSVSIDRDAILNSNVQPELYVSIDGTTDTIALEIDRAMRLPSSVIDAEYAKSEDVLVYVAEDATLGIYHPETRCIDVVQLSYPPLSVSVSQDGTKAIVGHADHATYVDLQTKRILTENEIQRSAEDIVMGTNGWAYAFRKYMGGDRIYCFDASVPNSVGSLHTGDWGFGGTKAKMHPSGKYIYGAINGLSSANIEKYDIQNGVAEYLYESSIGGLGGDLWFAEDGNRLYTRSGIVLKISENQEHDMYYNGTITIDDGQYSHGFSWIDHLERTQSLFVILGDANSDKNEPFVYEFNSANLIFRRQYPLDALMTYHVNGDFMLSTPDPQFVFANSNGEEIYVLSLETRTYQNTTFLQTISLGD